MSIRINKTKEELRNYDIFKGIVAVLIGILLLLSNFLGGAEPDEISAGGRNTGSTPTATAEVAVQEVAITAPVLVAPAAGSELQTGPVSFSGTGTKDSQVAVVDGSRELGRAPVSSNGDWELVAEMDPSIKEITLQALDSDGNVAASSDPIPFTVSDDAEEIAFEADPLPEPYDGVLVVSGSGPPGYSVTISLNDAEATSSEIDDSGAWSADVETGTETADVSASLISPDGENVETISLGQVEAAVAAPQVIAYRLLLPDFNPLTGTPGWSGEAEPDSQVALLVNGELVETVTADSDGKWVLNYKLDPDKQEIAFASLDADSNVVSQTEPQTIEIPGELPQVTLPEFSLPDNLLAMAEQAPGEAGSDAADAATEQERLLAGVDLNRVALPTLLLPATRIEWNGRTEPGSEIAFLVDGEIIDQTTADEDGRFSFTVDLIGEGDHIVQIGVLGDNGELVAESFEIPIKLADLALPTIEIPQVAAGGEPVTVIGTANAGDTVEVTADGEPVGETTADENGRWSLQLDSLPDASVLRAQLPGADGTPLLQSVPLFLSSLGAAVTAAGEATTTPAAEAVVSGTITSADTDTLPENTQITVQIQDVSLQDAPATVIGEQTIDAGGQQLPISYEVAYDPSEIDDQASYSMQVRIEDGDGNLLFINDTSIPVITNDNSTENVEVPVIQVSGDESTAPGAEEASITGTITYPDQVELADDAVVTVQLQDISTPGAAAAVLGEQTIETAGQQVPIPFEISYDPAEIVDNHTYSISARISDSAGNPLFVTDSANPVITNDNPTEDVQVETTRVNTAVSNVVLGQSADVIGEEGQSVIDAAEGSGNFSTLLDGLQAAGMTETLQDVEGEYTLFAPTDEAFDAIPAELADAWEAYPESYVDLMQHLVVEGKYTPDDLADGQVLTSLAGKDIQITREGNVIYANGVPVVDYAEVGNSAVYAMPQVILPLLSLNEHLPIIDESGVPTFVGPLLTVVGLGEPGSEILLTVDGEKFGEIATVEPNGFWLVKENVDSGVRYILAYMFDAEGILQGISQEVVLPVP